MKAKKNKAARHKSARKGTKKASGARFSDKELRKIQQELAKSMKMSVLIEQDIQKMKRRLSFSNALAAARSGSAVLDREFLFKCAHCVGEFTHTPRLQAVEHKVVCPKCSREHLLRIDLNKNKHSLRLPKTITIIKKL